MDTSQTLTAQQARTQLDGIDCAVLGNDLALHAEYSRVESMVCGLEEIPVKIDRANARLGQSGADWDRHLRRVIDKLQPQYESIVRDLPAMLTQLRDKIAAKSAERIHSSIAAPTQVRTSSAPAAAASRQGL